MKHEIKNTSDGKQVMVAAESRSNGRHVVFVATTSYGVVDADRKFNRLMSRLGNAAGVKFVGKQETQVFPEGEGPSYEEIAEAQRIANGFANTILKSKKSRAVMVERIKTIAETQTELVANELMMIAERLETGEKLSAII